MSPATRATVAARSRTALLTVLMFALAACGGATVTPAGTGQGTAAGSPAARVSATPTLSTSPSPTATPRPTPTAEPDTTPTPAPARDIATGLRIASPYRLRMLEPALADRLGPILDGYERAYEDYFSIGVREIQRSGMFEDVLLAFRLKPGITSSVVGSWDELIKGATMGGTLKSTTRNVAGVKVTYVSTNAFGLAILRLTGNRTYRNYIFEIVAPDQTKLAAATTAFIKANN
jgi:hypothetical protein